MDLIQQQNTLKGLTDEKLAAEMQSPTGAVPPFLVMTEVNRRKTERERYAGEQARAQKQTTVMDDLMKSMPPPPPAAPPGGAMPGGPPQGGAPMPPPGGLDVAAAAMAGGGAAPPAAPDLPAFAYGGAVGGITAAMSPHYQTPATEYSALSSRYDKILGGLDEDRNNARAMALIMAGAGIAGNGSSNFWKNLSAGAAPGLQTYQDRIADADRREQGALEGQVAISQAQRNDSLADMDKAWRERRAAVDDQHWEQSQAAADEANKTTAPTREFEYLKSLPPDEREEYLKMNPPPGTVNPNADVSKVFSDAISDAERSVPKADLSLQMPGADTTAFEAERQRQVMLQAYRNIKVAYGPAYAEEFAARAGLTDGDIATGGGAGDPPPGADNDPLGFR